MNIEALNIFNSAASADTAASASFLGEDIPVFVTSCEV
jgi:hypothetical protein